MSHKKWSSRRDVNDIPAEKMFGQFPEQACKKSRLKGGCEVDLLIGDDFVNQKNMQ
jgi:hypothetical protein